MLAERTGPFGPKTDAWMHRAVLDVLQEAGLGLHELDGIAAAAGPGTFTGIRVALATGLGLAAGAQLPVWGISTLDALIDAAAVGSPKTLGHIVAAIDARRGQYYAQCVHVAGPPELPLLPVWGPEAHPPEALRDLLRRHPADLLIGPEIEGLEVAQRTDPPPLAAPIARLAARSSPEHRPEPKPSYLRAPDAIPGTSPLRRRRALR